MRPSLDLLQSKLVAGDRVAETFPADDGGAVNSARRHSYAYAFDLDGVLIDSRHRAHHLRKRPPDWATYRAAADADTPITSMIALANALHEAGEIVLLITSRDAVTRDQTECWLAQHGVKYHELYMRAAGDTRLEYDVKYDLIADARAACYSPVILFDDSEHARRAAIAQGVAACHVQR